MKTETERLATRIRREDNRLIEKAAALSGISVSAFVKMRLREAALEVIDQEKHIKLSIEESVCFAEALLNPQRNIPESLKVSLDLHDTLVEEH